MKVREAMLRVFISWEPAKVSEQGNDMISSCFNLMTSVGCKESNERHLDLMDSAGLILILTRFK